MESHLMLSRMILSFTLPNVGSDNCEWSVTQMESDFCPLRKKDNPHFSHFCHLRVQNVKKTIKYFQQIVMIWKMPQLRTLRYT